MALTVRTVSLILALLLFAVGALGIGTGRFGLVPAGLFFLALAELVP